MNIHPSLDFKKISFVAKGVLVGALVGIMVSLFRYTINVLLAYTRGAYTIMRSNSLWIIAWVFLTLFVAFIVSKLIRDEPHIKGAGIRNVESQLYGITNIRWFSIFWRKLIGASLALGSGLALGRGGPSIHLGGVIGKGVNTFLKGNRSQENILLSSGVSAGLAAAFSAPLTGVMFILEEVHHKFSGVLLLTAFTSSIVANFVALRIFGIEPALSLGAAVRFPVDQYLHLVILGSLLAIIGRLYQEALIYLPELYKKLPFPSYYHGFIPFLLVIPIGLYLPNMLGGGIAIIDIIDSTRLSTQLLFGILLFRFVFSLVSYSSGLPGGIFFPVLCIGALVGALYGNLALTYSSIDTIYYQNFIMYAMGGLMTAVIKAPLTSIILIAEITGTESQLMPLSLVCLCTYVVANFLGSKSLYERLMDNATKQLDARPNGEKVTISLIVEADQFFDGLAYQDLTFPEEAELLEIVRYKDTFEPDETTVLKANDELIIQCDSGLVPSLRTYLLRHN
ncbi:ClC family H(+)/Cl(-) exchange transporter [Marinilactibacillus kalidii]|uniref:ClC family H(+)/Cl(-) exchange transporter n=1 Tax=Marinilactibacillus kalidii TaxID=2820274 RepID=UPI001ABE57A4|nr:ClC family H(+)/Cl(-) exchange transporter [Marinilactibacillus kalidii]